MHPSGVRRLAALALLLGLAVVLSLVPPSVRADPIASMALRMRLRNTC